MDYAALKEAKDVTIIKRCAVASNGITPAYRFRIPYAMDDNTVKGKITSRMTIIKFWMRDTFHTHSCQPSYMKH